MIDVNSEVKLNGYVSEVSTGTFKISITEFLVDGEWRQFTEPRVLEVAGADYNNHLTTAELRFLLDAAKKVSSTSNLTMCDRAVVDSILKKLSN